MFMLSSGEELRVFIEQNNMKDGVGWSVNHSENRVYFVAEKKDKKEIPSVQMINFSLDFATELNRII